MSWIVTPLSDLLAKKKAMWLFQRMTGGSGKKPAPYLIKHLWNPDRTQALCMRLLGMATKFDSSMLLVHLKVVIIQLHLGVLQLSKSEVC